MSKKNLFPLFIILIALSFCFSANSAFAMMAIPSIDINTNTTWTAAGGPYVFDLDVNIYNDAVLTIEPGTIVKLEYGTINIRNGQIIANGTEADKILITSENGANQYGRIVVYPAGKLNFSYAQMERGGSYDSDIVCDDYDLMDNCYTEEYYYGAIVNKGGIINISDSVITNNKVGLENQSGSLIIHNSKIYNNVGYGLVNGSAEETDATNNWWGNDTGPYHETAHPFGMGDNIKGDILFDPWTGQIKKKTPVIIVPGISSSYLNKNEPELPEVWPNIQKMLTPGEDSYLYDLSMNSSGWPEKNLLPSDIFKKINSNDYFQGLIDELKNNGYEEEKNLFVFPYDWRYFIEWSANEGDPFPLVKSLKEKIEEVKTQTGADKVDLVAHSMGGLIAKYYIKKNGTSSVDKFIDIATPHLGSPDASKILMFGDNLGVKISWYYPINSNTIKSISQNMPSIYQLLPSRNYFDPADNDYAYYIYDMHDLDNNGTKGRLNYDQSVEFMKNTGRNNYLLGFNNSLHSILDNYSPQAEGVKTYNIVGCGQPTLGQIFALNKEKSGGNEYGLKYINGDGTVPLKSAAAFSAAKTYYANGTEHAYLPSTDGIKQLVASILKGEEGSFNFSGHNNIREDKNNCSFSGTQISFHSPIALHVYEGNNHLGPNADGDIEMGIAGAQYDDLDGNKFVFLPKGHIYRIVGQATATGTFNARIQDVNNGEYDQTIYFNEVPLNSINANVEFQVRDNQDVQVLAVDENGDGSFEKTISPSSVLNENEAGDLESPTTEITVSGQKESDNIFTSDVTISLTALDNINGSGLLKTEYSLDNSSSWNIYDAPIVVNKKGDYTILYKATDRAGNIETTREYNFKIIATIDSTINDIKENYENGNIKKIIIRDWLVKQLAWLEQLAGKPKKIKLEEKIITKQYELILKQLDFYYRMRWINKEGYDVIKEDIKYLKSN